MKILVKYSTNKGDLWMGQGEQYFGVACHTLISPGSWRIREFGRLSHEDALEKFAELKAELDGRQYIKPKCKYSAARTRPCNLRNCPKKIGGAAYWEIFSNSCCCKVR